MPARPTREIVAENVRRFRKVQSLTQAALAEKIGRDQSRIAEIENARHDIGTAVIDELSEALEVSPAALITPVEKAAAKSA